MPKPKHKQKKKPWIRPRHLIVRNIAFVIMYWIIRLKYGIRPRPFREEQKRNYLILYNHQTAFDQFFVGMSFKGHLYYMASEDLFSKGFLSTLIRYLVAPIPIKKQSTDISAIMNCLRVAKEGGSIAIAPEGNRTYSGATEYMSPSIAQLAKKLKLPILLYRIEGGYGVHPRWSDKTRRGRMEAYVSRVIEPEEYLPMSDEELFAVIRDGLTMNEAIPSGTFKGSRRAEYIERAMYFCPTCGLSRFHSARNTVKCLSCNTTLLYGEDKSLRVLSGAFPFADMKSWYDAQAVYTNHLALDTMCDTPLYEDKANLYEVIVYKNKHTLRRGASITLYGNRVVVDVGGKDPLVLPFEELSGVSVLGKNKVNFYLHDRVYQIKGSKRMNALKYVHFYYRYKNIVKGAEHESFLGL